VRAFRLCTKNSLRSHFYGRRECFAEGTTFRSQHVAFVKKSDRVILLNQWVKLRPNRTKTLAKFRLGLTYQMDGGTLAPWCTTTDAAASTAVVPLNAAVGTVPCLTAQMGPGCVETRWNCNATRDRCPERRVCLQLRPSRRQREGEPLRCVIDELRALFRTTGCSRTHPLHCLHHLLEA
jgi:hypothetical protein